MMRKFITLWTLLVEERQFPVQQLALPGREVEALKRAER
jgi:hypothetical protein